MSDVDTLTALNADYTNSDQFSDVARYDRFLAPDFVAVLPDLVRRDRQEFLEMIGRERPFTGLAAHDVDVRVMGDMALVHGRCTYTTKHDGQDRAALYTDAYQKRDGRWVCVGAAVVALGE